MINKIFLESINGRLIVNLTFKTVSGNIVTRRCVPYNLGPHKRFKDKSHRYHLLVLKGRENSHPVFLLPKQILKIELTDVHFNPRSYIAWKPDWFVNTLWRVA